MDLSILVSSLDDLVTSCNEFARYLTLPGVTPAMLPKSSQMSYLEDLKVVYYRHLRYIYI